MRTLAQGESFLKPNIAHLTNPHKPKPPQPTKNKQYKERESQVHEVEVARAGRSLSPPKRDTNRGLLGGAPVARERWIDGWEAAALARRLLVLNSGCCERVVVSAGVRFQRGRGVRARAGVGRAGPKRSRDSARTAYLPFNS